MATSLKLPEELKARVHALARKAGVSPHAFMLEAIAKQTERAESRQRFLEDALEAEREVQETGVVYSADDVHAVLLARARGQKPPRLRPSKWRG
jgi:predicted transcriptional regulator